jgi:hypothetical protein
MLLNIAGENGKCQVLIMKKARSNRPFSTFQRVFTTSLMCQKFFLQEHYRTQCICTRISLTLYFLPLHFGQTYFSTGVSLFIFSFVFVLFFCLLTPGLAQCLVKNPLYLTVGAAKLVRGPFLDGTQLVRIDPYDK